MISRRALGGLGFCCAALALVPSGCFVQPPIQDCWAGLATGELVDVRIIEPYTPTGRFIWRNVPQVTEPSCGTRDGLGPGTFRFRMVRRFDFFGEVGGNCAEYVAAPVTPIAGVVVPADDMIRALTSGNLFSMQVPTSDACGFWELRLGRSSELDHDPFGETAVSGQLPPTIVIREVVGSCGTPASCADVWVAEVNHVAPTPDAGALDASTDAPGGP